MSTSSGMMIDYISEVGVTLSLLYGHVRAMSKFLVACFKIFKVLIRTPCIFKILLATPCIFKILIRTPCIFKILLATPCIFKVLMRAPCNAKVLAAFFLKLQGFVGIFEILMRSPCIFKALIGTPCIFNILLASLKSWCLATVLYALDVWAMLPLKIALWQRWTLAQLRCEWSVDVASMAKMQCWHGLSINGVLT